jgi:hypothetical protein
MLLTRGIADGAPSSRETATAAAALLQRAFPGQGFSATEPLRPLYSGGERRTDGLCSRFLRPSSPIAIHLKHV